MNKGKRKKPVTQKGGFMSLVDTVFNKIEKDVDPAGARYMAKKERKWKK
jgi:hypothetical protein